jgi:phosphoribosylaminoimidazole-succinocarboxamide synthase
MQKLKQIYEGKAKILYSTEDEGLIIQYFKDDATAFNNVKKDIIEGKGVLNNFISEFIMLELAAEKIPTHFVKRISNREQIVKKVKIIPLEVIIRNISAGSMAKRLGMVEGLALSAPIFEISYKNDALGDPLINDDHAVKVLKLLEQSQLDLIRNYALQINKILQKIFIDINIKLVDFKIEFGFDNDGNIILADEISPDSCRLWDKDSNNKMDKDRFRRDLGGLTEAYAEVANRLGIKLISN